MTVLRRFILLTWLSLAGLSAQTAILECVSAAEQSGRLRLTFRSSLAAKFKIRRATLLLHLDSISSPAGIKINGKAAQVVSREKNWITVPVPPKDALKPISVDVRSTRFHGCTPPQFAPYLIIEGPPSQETK